ncbi:hypothetical protein KDA_46710 [Dictyobacter alpinus]|uniref:Uncharacterized protein n=1 Tax=Dictyobacter alpinus TaxID=2014873 RepID=A0A402AZJ2_9CHLR|nr:hypothetical protein KDA_00100 [Dictyobacter alpinus]GCE29168.1 hypothetical protein KDA_46520 [Dictyobacter alpinus]GCE29187.1 hypothetical protein KDA_46710 [Dictyobacter alpinus]
MSCSPGYIDGPAPLQLLALSQPGWKPVALEDLLTAEKDASKCEKYMRSFFRGGMGRNKEEEKREGKRMGRGRKQGEAGEGTFKKRRKKQTKNKWN